MAVPRTERWETGLKVALVVVLAASVVAWVYFTFFGFHWA